jgi:hypothetical protein
MRSARFIVGLFVVLGVTVVVGADALSGSWKLQFQGPPEDLPTCCSYVRMNLALSGEKVTGQVLMGDWPGTAPIKEGTFKDGHLTVRAVGQEDSSTGYPQLDVAGTLSGADLKVTLTMRRGDGQIVKKWDLTGRREPR